MKINKYIALLILALLPSASFAFKFKTHVWIAQQVIDDLQDGKISISVDGRVHNYAVDQQIVDAILKNQKAYRMGNIGPDAAPDIIAGQLIIHPGTKTFGSDEWALFLEQYVRDYASRISDGDWYKYKENVCAQKDYDLDKFWNYYFANFSGGDEEDNNDTGTYLSYSDSLGILDAAADSYRDGPRDPKFQGSLDTEALAYQKGFLGHIAADTFAHSYVNYYAGDVFWLTDGELEVEKRHAAIETYIDKHLPDLPQGKAYNLIDSPSEFLANAFIFNDFASKQFATVDPELPISYFQVIHKFRKAIRNAASSCVWTAIERFSGQIATYALTGYVPSEHQVQAMNESLQDINNLGAETAENINKWKHKVDDIIADDTRRAFNKIDSALGKLESGIGKINELERKVNEAVDKVTNDFHGKSCDYEKKVCEKFCPPAVPCPCEIVKGPSCASYQPLQDAIKLRDAVIKERDEKIGGLISDLRENARKLGDAVEHTFEAFVALDNLAVSVTTYHTAALDPLHNALKRWDQNITKAMIAWVEAHAEAARQSIILGEKPFSDVDENCFKILSGISDCFKNDNPVFSAILDWKDRYGLSLLGVPPELTIALTEVNESLESISDFGDSSLRSAFLSASDNFTRVFLTNLQQNISKELSGIDVGAELTGYLLGDEAKEAYEDLLTVFSLGIDDRAVDRLFAQDKTNKALLVRQYFSQQLKQELAIGSNGKIQPDKFRALKNAVTLVKLSLLSSSQLNDLASDLGIVIPTYKYGDALYGNGLVAGAGGMLFPAPENNVIYGAIKNIDGSEQWKSKASEFPRQRGVFYDPNDITAANKTFNWVFGYSIHEEGPNVFTGFRFWEERPSGDSFYRLFDMPLHDDEFIGLPPALIVVIVNSILL